MKYNFSVSSRLSPALCVALLVAANSSCVKLPRHHSSLAEHATDRPLTQDTETTPRININTASMEELERLPGIGRALAARIISYRQQQGRFRRPEHLIMVRGISERRFLSMRRFITVE